MIETRGYPAGVSVPAQEERKRLSVLFRIFLAIPHLLLLSAVSSVSGWLAVFSWFSLLFIGRLPKGTAWVQQHYLAWWANGYSYAYLLRDQFPPFWEGEYATQVWLEVDEGERNKLSVFFRIFLLIPHAIALLLLGIVLVVVLLISWLLIVLAGVMPAAFRSFAEGYLRWSLRVSFYALLLTDEYPPFSLSE